MDIWPKIQLLNDSLEAFYVATVEAVNAFNVTYIDTRAAQRKRRRYFEETTHARRPGAPAQPRCRPDVEAFIHAAPYMVALRDLVDVITAAADPAEKTGPYERAYTLLYGPAEESQTVLDARSDYEDRQSERRQMGVQS